MKNYVITIARGFGSGGKTIGNMLSKELGIPCYERQILKMASEYSGISENLFVEVDEKLRGSYVAKRLSGIPGTNTIAKPTEKEFVSDLNLFNIQAEIIRNLAKTESCIIIGKYANNILRRYDNVISVYIEAPRAYCVQSIMNRLGVEEDEANRMIYHTDKYRAEYYKYYSGGEDWTNPTNYDLVLNTAWVSKENCVKLIKDYTEMRLSGRDI